MSCMILATARCVPLHAVRTPIQYVHLSCWKHPCRNNVEIAPTPCDDHVKMHNSVLTAVLQIVVVEIKNDKFKTDKAVQVPTHHPVHPLLASVRC